MEVSLENKYRTRDGQAVVLLAKVNNPNYPFVGTVINPETGIEGIAAWTAQGDYTGPHTDHPLDLVEEGMPKVGDPIMVRVSAVTPWRKRYFAGIHRGKVEVFGDGATAWSAETVTAWDEWRFPTPKELAETLR